MSSKTSRRARPEAKGERRNSKWGLGGGGVGSTESFGNLGQSDQINKGEGEEGVQWEQSIEGHMPAHSVEPGGEMIGG